MGFPTNDVFGALFGVPEAGSTTYLGMYPEDFYNRFDTLAQPSLSQWCSVSQSSELQTCPPSTPSNPREVETDPPPAPVDRAGGAVSRSPAGDLPASGLDTVGVLTALAVAVALTVLGGVMIGVRRSLRRR